MSVAALPYAGTGELSDEPFTEEELAALALGGDPEAAIPADAICLWDLVEQGRGSLQDVQVAVGRWVVGTGADGAPHCGKVSALTCGYRPAVGLITPFSPTPVTSRRSA